MRNTRLCSISGLFLVLLSCLGCERQAVRGDYFPFRDGNRWEYRLLDSASLKILGGEAPDLKSNGPAQVSEKTPPANSLKAETFRLDAPKTKPLSLIHISEPTRPY